MDTYFFTVLRFRHRSALNSSKLSYGNKHQNFQEISSFNPLTPKPAITGHITSILVGRVSAGYCSESGEKAGGRVVIKGLLGVEIRDERPFIHIFHYP
uniref:Uncharacterized protein n=1 Tax=Araneus ventricosus TaxID=182803 RepID=A0A4Y2WWX9_ARAVE|nr:hypothetical protein AVEN_258610-1 [Araneus ventricosus]